MKLYLHIMNPGHYISYSGRQVLSPALMRISFSPVLESLRKLKEDDDKAVSDYATSILTDLAEYPILEEGFSDRTNLKKYEYQVKRMLRVLFPNALQTNEIKAIIPPFELEPFYTSVRFENILKHAGNGYMISLMNFSDDEHYIFICCVILKQFYHYNIDLNNPYKISIPDVDQKINRIYGISFNSEMITITSTRKAPRITKEDFSFLIDRFTDIAFWKEKFPPGSYIISGLGIINLMDITVDQAIAGITTTLLSKSDTSLNEISSHLRTILNKPSLQIGYINFEKGTFLCATDHKIPAILMDNSEMIKCSTAFNPLGYECLIIKRQPLIITDTTKYDGICSSLLSKKLIQKHIRSYIILPLIYENHLLGFIELASKHVHDLSSASLKKLANVLPVLSMAMSHFKAEAKNEMDAVIQQEFTQLHPAVKWRFEEAALNYIESKKTGKGILKDIDFPDVFPLFGQLDVKRSSLIRNEVIQKDMSDQLGALKNILQEDMQQNPLPLNEELINRLSSYLADVNNGLHAASEHDVIHFIQKDINPFLVHLEQQSQGNSERVKKYRSQLDPQLSVFYNERKKFDDSIAIINTVLADHLDKSQLEAQRIFPHYFERYKTDGVEYNIYIGASIAKGFSFNNTYLRNLRLWQMIIMSELENEFHQLKKKLKEPLEIASMILVHSDPLTINFRVDEKKFDVKGAYNARYEIVKKRIDKAYIKGTAERITAPGKLAIFYSTQQEADEYNRYISFLMKRGYYKEGTLETIVVEDLPGITGLHAFRVGINYTEKGHHHSALNVFQLLEAEQENQYENL